MILHPVAICHHLPKLLHNQLDAMSPAFLKGGIALRAGKPHAVHRDEMSKFYSQGRNLILCALVALVATAKDDPASHHHDLGEVNFPVSCTPEAQGSSGAASPFSTRSGTTKRKRHSPM
jgi:hypothetical protein